MKARIGICRGNNAFARMFLIKLHVKRKSIFSPRVSISVTVGVSSHWKTICWKKRLYIGKMSPYAWSLMSCKQCSGIKCVICLNCAAWLKENWAKTSGQFLSIFSDSIYNVVLLKGTFHPKRKIPSLTTVAAENAVLLQSSRNVLWTTKTSEFSLLDQFSL